MSATDAADTAAHSELDQLCINTIRTLSMDAVQEANSGHPGTPMALAPVAYTLWQRYLRFDPDDPIWPNRDRFVLSSATPRCCSIRMLHLTGVKAVNAEVRAARRACRCRSTTSSSSASSTAAARAIPSTAGPRGVETTTGPLGQGVATSVGMAIAAQWLAAHFNRPGFEMFDYDVYALCGDGCMMEGISSEAASLAGHLKLSNLCWIYDNNHITIEGNTDLAFSEDVATRFIGYGWNVTRVGDANDLAMLERAFKTFKKTTDRPTLIIVDSHIACGAPNKQDTHARPRRAARRGGDPAHQANLRLAGGREVPRARRRARALRRRHRRARQRSCATRGSTLFDDYEGSIPELADQLDRMQHRAAAGGLGQGPADLPRRRQRAWPAATSSGKVLNAIAQERALADRRLGRPGAVDQDALTFDGAGDFQADNYGGRNFHFGIREHAMGAILNGMALSKVRPYGSGFLIFSDYVRPPIRLARDHGDPGHLHLHARLDRRRRRRPDASADRAAGRRCGRFRA